MSASSTQNTRTRFITSYKSLTESPRRYGSQTYRCPAFHLERPCGTGRFLFLTARAGGWHGLHPANREGPPWPLPSSFAPPQHLANSDRAAPSQDFHHSQTQHRLDGRGDPQSTLVVNCACTVDLLLLTRLSHGARYCASISSTHPARLLVSTDRSRSLSRSFACFWSPGSRFQRDRAKYLVLAPSCGSLSLPPRPPQLPSPPSLPPLSHFPLRTFAYSVAYTTDSSLSARHWKNNSARTITSARHQPDYTCNLRLMS